MIVAFDIPRVVGRRYITHTLDGIERPYVILREATFEEFLIDYKNMEQYPPSDDTPEEQLAIVKSKLHWFYDISVD
jgi:hypothetical protein